MAESDPRRIPSILAPRSAPPQPSSACRAAADRDAVVCDRCGADMFRMHAVWRCPVCRYKTDCCGW